MSDLLQQIACDVHPIKNGWKILSGGVRIGLASNLGTALSKISRISAHSGAPYQIRIFKEDGSFSSFSSESTQVHDETDLLSQGENPDAGVALKERIALLAYSYWEKRGRQGGSTEEDWYRAEREILNQVLIARRSRP
jgi:hypothetical protein